MILCEEKIISRYRSTNMYIATNSTSNEMRKSDGDGVWNSMLTTLSGNAVGMMFCVLVEADAIIVGLFATSVAVVCAINIKYLPRLVILWDI